MAKTNTGLVEYCKAKVGCYYWFGTFGQMASKSLYNSKKAQYPKYYTASDFAKQIANPKQVFDCAGLIKAYLWTKSIDDTHPVYKSSQDYGATGFYNNAKSKGSISSFQKIAGQLVFKGTDKTKSHVGVYIGNDQVIEAKGHAYGVIKSKFSSGGWKYWAQCHLIDKDDKPEPQPTPTPTPEPNEYVGIWETTAVNGLYMRTKAGTSADCIKITCIPYGSQVECFGESDLDGTWLKVTWNGMTGWCCKTYLSKYADYDSSKAGTYKVTAVHGLYMRTKAGKSNDDIKCMAYGSECKCEGFYKKVDGVVWLRVTQGSTGWSSSEYLSKK